MKNQGNTLLILIFIIVLAVVGMGIYFLLSTNDTEPEPMGEQNPMTNIDLNLPAGKTYAVMATNQGIIALELFETDAPKTVENFIKLSEDGFYNGTLFHRVIKDFMIQGGDPNSKNDDWSTHGTGGPGYTFEDEFNENKIVKGALAMANSGPNTNGSQFFIVTAESAPWLDGKHTVFGKVVEGMDTVLKIENTATGANDHPVDNMIIESIQIQRP
ncbi:MAG: peptidylprolyl isomerase [Patescibacteria group bacterium]